jgi:hypothetical protein
LQEARVAINRRRRRRGHHRGTHRGEARRSPARHPPRVRGGHYRRRFGQRRAERGAGGPRDCVFSRVRRWRSTKAYPRRRSRT